MIEIIARSMQSGAKCASGRLACHSNRLLATGRQCQIREMAPGLSASSLRVLRTQCRRLSERRLVRGQGKEFSQGKAPGLREKAAIVTGGGEGIGLAVVRTLLKYGVKGVTVADCSREKAKAALKELLCEFGEERVLFVEGDVSQGKCYDDIFKATLRQFESVDVVVNNAGVMNDVSWESQVSTNVHGTVIGTLLGLQYMSRTSGGAGGVVVNVASIMGLIPSAGFPIHTLTQFGVVGFSRAVGSPSHFERTGVKVVAVCPGLTDTKLLRQAPYHAINDRFRREFKEESAGCALQRADCVGLAVLEVVARRQEAAPGSVWVVENDSRPYEISFPEVADMRFKNKC